MKKLISGLLSLLLLSLVMAVPAYADNNAANDKTPPRSTTSTSMNRAGVNDMTDMVPGMNNVRNDMDRMDIFRNDNTDNNAGRVRAAATDDNRMDWGWLGLLGLIGLAGLRGGNRQRT
jgi:MYXO-CTERM domain-containing protein